MATWQVSYKKEVGGYMHLQEFQTMWRAVLWLARNLCNCRIAVVVRIEE